jgi:hypothetical protein
VTTNQNRLGPSILIGQKPLCSDWTKLDQSY